MILMHGQVSPTSLLPHEVQMERAFRVLADAILPNTAGLSVRPLAAIRFACHCISESREYSIVCSASRNLIFSTSIVVSCMVLFNRDKSHTSSGSVHGPSGSALQFKSNRLKRRDILSTEAISKSASCKSSDDTSIAARIGSAPYLRIACRSGIIFAHGF